MLSRDPYQNVLIEGIIKGIRITIEAELYRATIQLIYSGIDTMAFLDMPASQDEVKRQDFIAWCEKYISFPCTEQLTGLDLYGARCSMLHSYGHESYLSRKGDCRIVGYMDQSRPEVIYQPDISGSLVLVSVPALAEAFFQGIIKFLEAIHSDPEKMRIVEERLRNMIHILPIRP